MWTEFLTATEHTLLISLPSTLVPISGSHFHTYFLSHFLNLRVLFYFDISRSWQQCSFLVSPSVVGPLVVGVQPCAMSFLHGELSELVGRISPASRCLIFLPRLCTFMKTNWELVLECCQVSAFFFREINMRMCDISKIRKEPVKNNCVKETF